MISTDYFDRRETPAQNSPIARIMRELDVIYPDLPAEELRAVANKRIHSGGPARVKWTREESRSLKDAGVLSAGGAGEQFSPSRSVLSREDSFSAPTQAENAISAQEVR